MFNFRWSECYMLTVLTCLMNVTIGTVEDIIWGPGTESSDLPIDEQQQARMIYSHQKYV